MQDLSPIYHHLFRNPSKTRMVSGFVNRWSGVRIPLPAPVRKQRKPQYLLGFSAFLGSLRHNPLQPQNTPKIRKIYHQFITTPSAVENPSKTRGLTHSANIAELPIYPQIYHQWKIVLIPLKKATIPNKIRRLPSFCGAVPPRPDYNFVVYLSPPRRIHHHIYHHVYHQSAR